MIVLVLGNMFSHYICMYIYGNKHTFPLARPSVGVWIEVGLDLRLAVIMIKPNTPFDSYSGNFCLEWGLIYHIISVQPLTVAIPPERGSLHAVVPWSLDWWLLFWSLSHRRDEVPRCQKHDPLHSSVPVLAVQTHHVFLSLPGGSMLLLFPPVSALG